MYRPTMNPMVLLLAASAAVTLGLGGCGASSNSPAGPSGGTSGGTSGGGDTESLRGQAAPDFSLTTVDGQVAKLSLHKGSVVVLDFWATWCPPCRKSLPHLQQLSADKELAAKGLKVLAVNAREEKAAIEAFLKEGAYTFTVPMDAKGEALRDYRVNGIPTTVIVGRDGIIKDVFIGYNEDAGRLIDQAVNRALAERAG